MMKTHLVILSGLLLIYVLSSNAECDVPGKNKGTETTPLHHIIEFGKRSQIGVKGCGNKTHTKSNATKLRTALGLHGLLHVKSQHTKQETGTRRQSDSSVTGETIFKNVNDDVPIKGTDEEQKKLHKLRLRAETISMLHKIVDKYFPGGHLTVDQKIKALKILGKLIKLKKEGKTADLKAILNSLSKKNQLILKTEENSKLKKLKNTKDKTLKDKDADGDGGKSGGDIYATIANGPDIPKLPPSVTEKDSDHAHSNIMPVGFQPRGGGGDFMNSMGQHNDISDDLRDSLTAKMGNYESQYSNGGYPGTSLGMAQIYNNGNRMSLSNIPMMNAPGYTRSRMPFAPRYRHIGSYGDGRRYDDDGNDDDDGDDDDDDDDDDDEEVGRTRSYVHRHDDDDDDDDEDDSDDNDEVEYSRHFDRKDKIAKNPMKGNTQRKSKKKNAISSRTSLK